MAYIIVTTDDGKIAYKKHHTEYPSDGSRGGALFLNDLARAVAEAEAYTDRRKRLKDASPKT